MIRIDIAQRENWKNLAKEVGFKFHTINDEPYWDESACYRFTLKQIEDDIEDPSLELEQMCFQAVDYVIENEEWLEKFKIPHAFWDYIKATWKERHKNLYGRMDFSYDGTGPAKLLEYNADTPTSLYETSAFQWLWLEQAIEQGIIPPDCDQFNSIHERLVDAFAYFKEDGPLHLASCQGNLEDEGTVLYLQECAEQAGLETHFMHIEEIGLDAHGTFSDLQDNVIKNLFKLYPWEWMMQDEFGLSVLNNKTRFIEPAWKTILSNKALMVLLWKMFPEHPNLLETYFAEDKTATNLQKFVKKPLFSREGANVTIHYNNQPQEHVQGPYGAEGYIIQNYKPLAKFGENHTVIGSWLVASQPCGIGLREDKSAITQDSSRFIPHVIRD